MGKKVDLRIIAVRHRERDVLSSPGFIEFKEPQTYRTYTILVRPLLGNNFDFT